MVIRLRDKGIYVEDTSVSAKLLVSTNRAMRLIPKEDLPLLMEEEEPIGNFARFWLENINNKDLAEAPVHKVQTEPSLDGIDYLDLLSDFIPKSYISKIIPGATPSKTFKDDPDK